VREVEALRRRANYNGVQRAVREAGGAFSDALLTPLLVPLQRTVWKPLSDMGAPDEILYLQSPTSAPTLLRGLWPHSAAYSLDGGTSVVRHPAHGGYSARDAYCGGNPFRRDEREDELIH
jgi:hypothetical protein